MLCSSPISTRIFLYTLTLLPSYAGIIIPLAAIADKRPMVLIATVLPPVLGPVITRVSKSEPRRISVATTFLGSMRGCLALLRRVMPLSLSSGTDAFI